MLERSKKGRIHTFYSYKGGVGRTMALANVAALMTKWGKKVLIVDWDLEAPGLELFFNTKPARLEGSRETTPGVVDLLYAKAEKKTMDWHTCLLEANIIGGSLSIISAGEKTHDYQSKVQHLNWDELFEKHGIGNYIDELRNQWIREYDFILVDSRTGITDIGDICTVLLPDVLVLLFISNYQNIFGIQNVMERATKAHKNLPVNRSRLIGVPVSCRDEVYNEYDRSQKWKEIFAEKLGAYYNDWLPRGVSPRDALNKLFIPYVANWSFGERLPVVENENEIYNPTSISAAYSRLTKLLISGLDWNELAAFSDPHELSQARIHALNAKAEAEQAKRKTKKLTILSLAAILALISTLSVYLFWARENRRKAKHYQAWQVIIAAQGKRGNLGRMDALKDLHSDGISLAGIDLSKAYLPDLNLENANLSDANFNGADLSRAVLSNANLSDANFNGADLSRAVFSMANLNGANLTDANLADANLSQAVLKSAKLTGAFLLGANLTEADLTDANLAGVELTVSNLSGAVLERANLAQAYLAGAKLSEAKLSSANLSSADLVDANLFKARLTNANLVGAKLKRANLAATYLADAKLDSAYLASTNLSGANLTGANLAGAHLVNANLSSAVLENVNLAGADLSEAVLTNIMDWQKIKSVKYANIYNVKNIPKQFEEWATNPQQGAVSIQSYEEWKKFLRKKMQETK